MVAHDGTASSNEIGQTFRDLRPSLWTRVLHATGPLGCEVRDGGEGSLPCGVLWERDQAQIYREGADCGFQFVLQWSSRIFRAVVLVDSSADQSRWKYLRFE